MALTMNEKKSVGKEWSKQYRKASKKRKSEILDEFIGITGYNRCYAARKLLDCVAKHTQKARQANKKKRGRKQVYGECLLEPLRIIWESFDYACAKRVHAGMEDMLGAMLRFSELWCTVEEIELLEKMSASTIERLLRPVRKQMTIHGRSATKPGTLLKSQIPVRLGDEWDDGKAGFEEIDLVAHCGDSTKGDYANTLDMTDIETCWCETRAVLNKAQKHVFEAIKHIRSDLPFPLRGIDSDNGSEFINDQLLRYCREEDLVFTRSRPNRKNDSCHVEQKNWSVVRQNVGYGRFETQGEVDILNELYSRLRLHTNFFMPSMKLIEKKRNGSRVSKRYDTPKTPYHRVLESENVPPESKRKLEKIFPTLNPVTLREEIAELRDELYRYNKQRRVSDPK